MEKVPILMREPRMWDYNKIANIVNQIIDKLEKKREVVEQKIERVVKDYVFFKWKEVIFPYEEQITISSPEDYQYVIDHYNLTNKEIKQMKESLDEWKIIWLAISVQEEMTDKDIKQEMMFNTIATASLDDITKSIQTSQDKIDEGPKTEESDNIQELEEPKEKKRGRPRKDNTLPSKQKNVTKNKRNYKRASNKSKK